MKLLVADVPLLEEDLVTRILKDPVDLGGERRIRARPADEEIR